MPAPRAHVRRRSIVLVAACVMALVGLAACGGGEPLPPRPRLVLLFATCSLNKSYLEPYNGAVAYTPALAAFARRGKVFGAHRAQVGVSGPSFASIFTGADMSVTGAYFHPKPLPDRVWTLAEVFAEGGFETRAWLTHPQAGADLNFAQGARPRNHQGRLLRAKDRVFRRNLDRLLKDPERRLLLLTNFTFTHFPYNPGRRLVPSGHTEPVEGPSRGVEIFCERYPAECAGLTRERLRRYREVFLGDDRQRLLFEEDPAGAREFDGTPLSELAEVAEVVYKSNVHKVDTLFGQLLAEIDRRGLLEESLVVFTADHGEFLYDESRSFNWSHGKLLTPMDLEPPLILAAPGSEVEAGRIDGLSRHIDLFPTLAGFAGLSLADEVREQLMGVDLSASIRGAAPWPELTAFSATSLKPVWRENDRAYTGLESISVALREGDFVYKLMAGGGLDGARAYDLAADPREERNVFDPENDTHRRKLRELVEYRRRLIEAYPRVADDPLVDEKLSPEALEELDRTLQALGYVG